MKQTLKNVLKKNFQSLAFFYRYLGYRLVLFFMVSMLVGLLDGLGLTMFIPLLESVSNESSASANMGNLGFIITAIQSIGLNITITVVLLIMLLFFVLKGIAKYYEGLLTTIYQQLFIRMVRIANITALSRYSYENFIHEDAGRIQNTLSVEVERMVKAYQSYMVMINRSMLVVAYLGLAFLANPQFAVLIAIGGGLSNFLFNALYRKTKHHSTELVKSNQRFQGLLLQMVTYFKYLTASGSILSYSDFLKMRVEEIEKTQRSMGVLSALLIGLREPLVIAVVVVVILFQINVLGGTLGAIMLSLLLFYRALSAVTQVQSSYNGFLALSGSLYHIESFTKEIQEGRERTGKVAFNTFNNALVLNKVSFSFKNSPIIRDISLSIHKNESVAIVGESGSGKTTLMNVLTGLLQPQRGVVLVDGVKLSEYELNSFRKRIGYITQEAVVFDDTVFNNVTFWDEPTRENIHRCWKALEQASVMAFVEGLPDQLQARLGNNGINLSGGQKQRISIARELYKEVDFLFMDEATSALDSETEKMIQENIDQLKGRYTILIIAHRLSTIKNADKVVVMKEGKIDTIGTYQDLIQQSGSFKRMVELQEL